MSATQTDAATQNADFVISRVFDAPRDLVWKAFTEPERMKEWWGPKGCTVIASKMDLRPGGTYLMEACVSDTERQRDVSPALHGTFRVRDEHDFRGLVDLEPRFEPPTRLGGSDA